MVKHIVMWNLADKAHAAENAATMKQKLEALVGVVPGLLSAQVGAGTPLTARSRSSSTGSSPSGSAATSSTEPPASLSAPAHLPPHAFSPSPAAPAAPHPKCHTEKGQTRSAPIAAVR